MGRGRVLKFLLGWATRLVIHPIMAASETTALPQALNGRFCRFPGTSAPPGRPFRSQRTWGAWRHQVRLEPRNSAFHPKSPVALTAVRLTAGTRGSGHAHLCPTIPSLGGNAAEKPPKGGRCKMQRGHSISLPGRTSAKARVVPQCRRAAEGADGPPSLLTTGCTH